MFSVSKTLEKPGLPGETSYVNKQGLRAVRGNISSYIYVFLREASSSLFLCCFTLRSNPVVNASPSLASTELRGAGTVVAAVRPGPDRVAQQVLGFLTWPLLFPRR